MKDDIKKWVNRAQRRGVQLDAVAYRPDNTKVTIKVSDLSYNGCCICTERTLEVGERIRLVVTELGEIDARVRWSEENRAGVAFIIDSVLVAKRRFKYGASQERRA